jgi:5'-nucleotidase
MKENKKILYLDMDGVIADFDKAIKSFNPDLHTSCNFPDPEARSAAVDKICEENPNIFHSLPPVEGAIEATKELFELFEVYFLSTAMWNVPESFTGKRIWLEKHFGELAKKRLILTHRKDLVVGDYLVDDRLKNGADKFSGKHIHFGTTVYPDWSIVLPLLKHLALPL